MSSLPRRIARKRLRLNASWVHRERPYRNVAGGYETLHPTGGWQRVSAIRLFAQNKLRYMIETKDWRLGKI